MAEKLNPYGFIRTHRSVVVNISAVEVIQPLPTGEYGLCVKGGKEYLVTRKYKHNLRDLARKSSVSITGLPASYGGDRSTKQLVARQELDGRYQNFSAAALPLSPD
jgi:hypothetical protein